jgi:hypothetical protein
MILKCLLLLYGISKQLLQEKPTYGEEVGSPMCLDNTHLNPFSLVPSQWRTLSGDMDPNPAFLDLFKNEFDALSPWTVGRYHNQETIDRFADERTRGDINELKDLPRRVDFFPTIFPGGSVRYLDHSCEHY